MASAPDPQLPKQNDKGSRLSRTAVTLSFLLVSLVASVWCVEVVLKHTGWDWDTDFGLETFSRLGPHRDFSSSSRANFLFPKSTDQVVGEGQIAAAEHASKASFRHRVLGAGGRKLESESLQPIQLHECSYETSVAEFSPLQLAPHVRVTGSGSSKCTTGEVCAFRIVSTTDTYWDTDNKGNREVFFTYEGSSRGVGDLAVDYASPYPAWIATYTIWDQGNFTFRIRADCNSVMESSLLAEFAVTIHEPKAWSRSSLEADKDTRLLQDSPEKDSPCDHGVSARWLRKKNKGKTEYSWTPFDCAPTLEQPDLFIKHLNQAGYTRLTFIGDSHQRVLYMHMKFLLAGHADASERRQHGDMSYTIQDGDSLLELRYYWVDGIYQNNEFGCHNRGMYSGRNASFPDVEPGPGMIYIFDAGTWTAASCAQPQLAYAKHLPEYLDWAQSFKQEGSKLVWRTTPSWRGACNRKNAVLAWTNQYAIPMVSARKDFQIFDSWEIEAPRYWDLCDWHYSCLKSEKGTGKERMVMKGEVGEAVTRSLLTWLVKSMK